MINDPLYTYLCMNIGMEFPCTVWDEDVEAEILTTAVLTGIDSDGYCELVANKDISVTTMYDNVLPSLYKITDMTEAQLTEFRSLLYEYGESKVLNLEDIKNISIHSFGLVNWLNKNKIDYFGLIEKNQAFYAKSNHEVIHL